MKIVIVLLVSVVIAGCTRDTSRVSGTVQRDSIVATDAYGIRVAVPSPAVRIVSLAPNVTEILFALGAQQQLVGVTQYCTYPAAAQAITKVGDLQTPNYELLSALKPDVTFMSFSGNMPPAYEKLRALGMRPFLTSSKTIEDVEMSLRTVAHMIGRDSTGKMIADAMCVSIDSLRGISQRTTPIDAVILLSVNPPIAVGGGFLEEELSIAGGRNVAHDDVVVYPQINRETLAARKPRVIIIPTDVTETTEEIWHLFPEWNVLRRSGTRIERLDADMLSRPGPRIVGGIQLVRSALFQRQ